MDVNFAEVLILIAITAGAVKAAAYFAAEAARLERPVRYRIAIQAITIQAVVLAVFAAFGPNILDFFHVSVAALEVAGGLILLLFAIGLVLGEGHDSSEGGKAPGAEMAIYPLAVPLLATPQAIVATTIFSAQMGLGNRGMLWGALAIVVGVNLAVMLALAHFIGGKKAEDEAGGPGFAAILLRVVALLLAALAVEIIVLGLRGYGVMGPMPGGGAH